METQITQVTRTFFTRVNRVLVIEILRMLLEKTISCSVSCKANILFHLLGFYHLFKKLWYQLRLQENTTHRGLSWQCELLYLNVPLGIMNHLKKTVTLSPFDSLLLEEPGQKSSCSHGGKANLSQQCDDIYFCVRSWHFLLASSNTPLSDMSK